MGYCTPPPPSPSELFQVFHMSSTLMCMSARWKLLCLALGSLYFRSSLINWGRGCGGWITIINVISSNKRLHVVCLRLTSSVSVMSTVPSASSSIILWMLQIDSKLSREFSSWQSGGSITHRSATQEELYHYYIISMKRRPHIEHITQYNLWVTKTFWACSEFRDKHNPQHRGTLNKHLNKVPLQKHVGAECSFCFCRSQKQQQDE